MNNRNRRNETSLALIVLALFCFPPLGLYLLYRRAINEKADMLRKGNRLQRIGWAMVVLGIIYIFMGLAGQLTELSESAATIVIFDLIFLGIGIWSITKGKYMSIQGEKHNRYISVINGGQTNLNAISSAVSVPYQIVVKDLQKMIEDGILENAYIDLTTREIVLSYNNENAKDGYREELQKESYEEPKQKPQSEQEIRKQAVRRKVIKCPFCGANNEVVEGRSNRCEYCESPMDFPD